MKTLFSILFLLSGIMLFGQKEISEMSDPPAKSDLPGAERIAITLGFLQGGGALIGGDLEVLATDRIGLQLGGGFVGYGLALNYHFKPQIRSSALSLVYWHQGFGGDTFAQSAIGGTFLFRAKKLFTAQLGLGYRLDSGPALPEGIDDVPVMLLYSIGLYICP